MKLTVIGAYQFFFGIGVGRFAFRKKFSSAHNLDAVSRLPLVWSDLSKE